MGVPPRQHEHAGRAPLACVPARRPTSDHAPAVARHKHGGSHDGMAPQPPGQSLLGMGGSCTAHGVDSHPHPATVTMGGGGAMQVLHPVPYPQVPGTPSSGPALHGPTYTGGHAVGAGPSAPDPTAGALRRTCDALSPLGPGGNLCVQTEPGVWFHDLPPGGQDLRGHRGHKRWHHRGGHDNGNRV